MDALARPLIVVGALLLALGLWIQLGFGLPPLGRLPGDLHIERPGFRLFLPITSCVVVSVVLSALFWLLGRGR